MANSGKSLRALFDEASEIQDEQARAVFLDGACAGDAALRVNLEDLLRAQASVGGFLADLDRDSLVLAEPIVEQAGDRIGRYKLLQKIGEGGCGVVYMAEQLEPVRRRVALKVIKLGMDTASMVARFEAERQALALMDHPGVARVLDAGATETGRPFFVMELVRGTKITEFSEQNRLSIPERLELFNQVCQAVQHAHQKGIIHRDLKPSNILVTANDGVPLPKVIDFGIAKATADVQLTDKTVFTRFEMFLGTPAYMSPEQGDLNADDVDTRTDIYSLGVLLYELLTGRPPFESESWHKSGIEALRKAIREKEPTRPSTRLAMELKSDAGMRRRSADAHTGAGDDLIRHRHEHLKESIVQLRGDLDWIVLKALEKDRSRRYETASAFAMDIQRHLRHEPVEARPPSPLYLLQKSVRRHRATFVVGAAIVLLLVAGAVFATRDAVRTRRAEKVQRDLRQKAESNERQAELARNEADAANRTLHRSLFIREWLDAETQLDEGKIASALAWFARAARDHPDDAAVQTRLLSLLTERAFVVPAAQPLVHGSPVNNAAFLSDGRHLATAQSDGTVQVWLLGSSSSPLVLSNRFDHPLVAASPSQNLLLVEDARSVSLWNLNGMVKSVQLSNDVGVVLPVSNDGRLALIFGTEGDVQPWEMAQLNPVGPPFGGTKSYAPVSGFSPDDKYLLGLGGNDHIVAWDFRSRRLVWQTPKIERLDLAQVSPDGRSVVISRELRAGEGELSGWTFKPALSSDAAPPTASSEGWSVETRSAIGSWCFSREGHDLYVGDAEGHLGIFNFATPELHALNAEHDGHVTWMRLTSDGQRLATASTDGTVRFWDIRMKSPDPTMITNGKTIWNAKFSPDSRWFVCSGADAAEVHDARTGALLKRLPLNQFITDVDISRDGRRIAASGGNGGVGVWDSGTGAPLFPAFKGEQTIHIEFSPDGRRFLVMSGEARVRIYETETGRQIGPTLTNFSRGVTATFHPGGQSLVVGTDNGRIEFWSLPEGRRIDSPGHHKDVIWSTRFSRDGKLLLTAARDRTAALWDAETGNLVREFRHEEQVYDAAFSPDGTRIVTGDASRKAHVWDISTGRRLFSLPTHPGGVWYCEFSVDGQILLTGDDLGNARLWDASSGLPLSGWVRNGSSLQRAHLSPDGRIAMSASNDGTVRLWPVLRAPLPAPGWLPELAEALAGRRLRDDGASEIVPAERWDALAAALRAQEGQDFYARWARWFSVERFKEHPASFTP